MIRSRFGLYWILFLLSSLSLAGVAAAYVVKELIRFREQSHTAVTAQLVQSEAQLASLLDEVKTEATRQLVGFHEEGLEFELNKWVKENSLIEGAAVWNEDSGLEFIGAADEGSRFKRVLDSMEELPWITAWSEEGALKSIEDLEDETFLGLDRIQVRVAEGSNSYGYLLENMAILQYDDVETEPYIGWLSLDHDGSRVWIFWHQLAVNSEVRVFALDLEELGGKAKQVVTNFVATDLLVELSLENEEPNPGPYAEYRDMGKRFPGWFLSVEMAEEGRSQESIIILTGVLVVGLFLFLIVGGSALIYKAHTGYQDMLQKTTFVSAVSHELKTPLTSIRMYAELMGNKEIENAKRLQYADTIHRESQRLTSLINNLLTFSSLEHGKRKYRKREFDLVELVDLTVKDYGQTIRASGFECEVNLPDSSIEVNFDESVVKQVLINLIENVLKHAKEGGWIEIEIMQRNQVSMIDVSDKGPGIEPGIRDTIFEAFVQGSTRLDNKKSGTGLGLSIARSMMKDCGGDLVLLDGGKSGATFRMIIG